MIDSQIVTHTSGNEGAAVGAGFKYAGFTAYQEGRYPDGSPYLKTYNDRVMDDETLILRPTSFASFMRGLMFAAAADERDKPFTTLVLPFIPGGRQDRMNDSGDYLYTLKYVGKLINDLKFDKVVTVDPHSIVSNMAIDRLQVFPLSKVFENYWTGYTGVIAPDRGAEKRAGEIAATLGRPLLLADKTRDVATGKLTGFKMLDEPVEGGHYLVADDICDGGGTFMGLGEVLKDKGVWADLYVTHGIFSKEDTIKNLHKHYKKVITTDSTLFDHQDTISIDIMDRMIRWMQ